MGRISRSIDINRALRSRQRGFLLNPFRFSAAGGGFSVVASDDFNRADGDVGSNWTYLRLTSWDPVPPQIVSNALTGKVTGETIYQAIRWNGAGTFGNDQYSRMTVRGSSFSGGGQFVGPAVRMSADTDAGSDYYCLKIRDNALSGVAHELQMFVMQNGTESVIDTRSVIITNGDIVAMAALGTALRIYLNGSLAYTVTDATLSGGKPGLVLSGNATTGTIHADDWDGGNFS